VSPDVFANNRLSSVLDTGKPVEELLARLVPSLPIYLNELRIVSPESKHVGTSGITSYIEHTYELLIRLSNRFQPLMRFYSLDMGFKSSCYLTETLLDPEFAHAHEPNKATFNKAYNVKEDAWSWIERPENKLHLVRFGAAMNGLTNATPANAILKGSVTFCCIHCTPSSHLQNIKFCRVRLGTPS
jgi:hypothetical protein